jgi:hypothetical protein
VGAVAAAATIAFFQAETPATVNEQVRAEQVRVIDASGLDRARLDRLEQELALLRQGAARKAAPREEVSPSAMTGSHDLAPPPDPEREYAEQQGIKEDWLTRHAREAVNARWAPGAEQDIDLDLDRLRQQSWAGRNPIEFEIVDVSCRTSLCVAEVRWDSARSAVEKGAYLATQDYAQNCTVTVFGPSPEELGLKGPFLQKVFFDCA